MFEKESGFTLFSMFNRRSAWCRNLSWALAGQECRARWSCEGDCDSGDVQKSALTHKYKPCCNSAPTKQQFKRQLAHSSSAYHHVGQIVACPCPCRLRKRTNAWCVSMFVWRLATCPGFHGFQWCQSQSMAVTGGFCEGACAFHHFHVARRSRRNVKDLANVMLEVLAITCFGVWCQWLNLCITHSIITHNSQTNS